MGDIFSKTIELIAWLGPQTDDSNKAMEFMKVFDEVASGVITQEQELDIGKPICEEECQAHDDNSRYAL